MAKKILALSEITSLKTRIHTQRETHEKHCHLIHYAMELAVSFHSYSSRSCVLLFDEL